jgi:hypothetical protein
MCDEAHLISSDISVCSMHLKLYIKLSVFHLDFGRFEVSFTAKNLVIKNTHQSERQ